MDIVGSFRPERKVWKKGKFDQKREEEGKIEDQWGKKGYVIFLLLLHFYSTFFFIFIKSIKFQFDKKNDTLQFSVGYRGKTPTLWDISGCKGKREIEGNFIEKWRNGKFDQ